MSKTKKHTTLHTSTYFSSAGFTILQCRRFRNLLLLTPMQKTLQLKLGTSELLFNKGMIFLLIQ